MKARRERKKRREREERKEGRRKEETNIPLKKKSTFKVV